MYESPYTALLLHQDKAREAVNLAEQRHLLYDQSEPEVANVNEAGLLSRIKSWVSRRNHPTQVATGVRRVTAH